MRNAARIYAESFTKDPAFYDFYRAMQSYRFTFGADGAADQGLDVDGPVARQCLSQGIQGNR